MAAASSSIAAAPEPAPIPWLLLPLLSDRLHDDEEEAEDGRRCSCGWWSGVNAGGGQGLTD